MPVSKRKVIIVTGSSSGIGAVVARIAAERGYNVLVNYNSNRAGADAVVADCKARGAEAIAVCANVAEDSDCRKLATAASETWGRIDVLVNNAGTTKLCAHSDLEGLDAGDFQRIYAVNTIGAFQMIRAVVPVMKQTGGAIVNVASVAGLIGAGTSLAYACSKAALLAINKSMARNLGPEIRVNAVCPGFVEGEWLQGLLGADTYAAVKGHYEGRASTGRVMTPETVAENIWFFADGAPNVTGEHLLMDGGATLPY
ncbi:MAG: SDR family oxidoreductase [Gammaproteobacteria bacterium]|jgi:3-oxoacyl-[acyl-carrier protein] reductase|nr:SDR family oxidoreductase [Gammaproteobacteria bacterium]